MRIERTTLPVERPGPLARMMGGPFSLLEELRSELDRFWEFPRFTRGDGEKLTWWPKMDVFRRKGELVVRADLPGMKKENVEVAIEEGDLILRGERKEEAEVEEGDVYRWERQYGSFFRRLPLTFEVEPEAVQASFKDGVLEVTLPLPKEEKRAKLQKIAVH
ncbi:MAG TPA: Hsp20/alpha crystallin family protein [Thermoanaerobaculia bacterium]|nr:Hsp20/alpha crystallin family protein [Thermoanaerobaculia bacterium]